MWSRGSYICPTIGARRYPPPRDAFRVIPRLVFGFALLTTAGLRAQVVGPTSDSVTMNFPDQVDLQVLVELVGKTLNVRFVYSDELKDQRVELRPSPITLPKGELLQLLTSLLRVRDLTLIEESPGFYRIVRSEQAMRSVTTILPSGAEPQRDSLRMVTQVLAVPPADVKVVAEKLAAFLSSPKSSLVPLAESGRIIVTDYEARIVLLQELLGLLVGGTRPATIETIPARGADLTTLAAQLSALLAESHKISQSAGVPPSVRGDLVPGSLVVVGTNEQIEQARALVERFVPPRADLATRMYQPRYINLDRMKRLIDHVVLAPGSNFTPPTSVFADAPAGRLIVTADMETLNEISRLFEREDHALPETERPLRMYRPKNRKAETLLATLSQLLEKGVAITAEAEPKSAAENRSPPGPNRPPSPPGQVPPLPPAQATPGEPPLPTKTVMRVEGPDYVLTADDHTNSILAVGTREFHAQLEAMINDLDKRRPQVLIEMTLVGITLSDSLDLGVELETLDLGDAVDYLLFSNFGLSEIDPVTGQRVLIPGVGGNGVLITPTETPILLRTLATKANGKIVSTPKLLVSDNAVGTLRNVDEAPFTSVNASDTVATTSFAGFESAGTTLNVTPHISEGDYLTLEYNLTFSNFSGSSSSSGVPPPRTTNSFQSTVEVPDGFTLITGGLIVDNKSDTVSQIPFLGDIPILGFFFQNSGKKKNQTKIFAFIRPTILRDDEFAALKYMTLQDAERAELQIDDAKHGSGLWMR